MKTTYHIDNVLSLSPWPCPPSPTPHQVSELRQQLRKRGLPVSGTKPALLQRLLPFQLPRTCPAPTPLCQLDTSLEPLTPSPLMAPNQSPSSSPGSGPDSPSSSPNQQLYVQPSRIPNGILSSVPNCSSNGVPNGILHGVPNGFTNAISVSVAGEQCGLTNAVFLAPAGTPSATPSPSLPLSSSSSPLQCGNSWRTEQEQQQQQQQELSVELEMRERIRTRPRDRSSSTGNKVRTEDLPGGLEMRTHLVRGSQYGVRWFLVLRVIPSGVLEGCSRGSLAKWEIV